MVSGKPYCVYRCRCKPYIIEMVTDVAKVIVQNAELALKVMKHAEEYGIEKKEIPVMLTE